VISQEVLGSFVGDGVSPAVDRNSYLISRIKDTSQNCESMCQCANQPIDPQAAGNVEVCEHTNGVLKRMHRNLVLRHNTAEQNPQMSNN
jgi:hypothetical protein